jgi:hypothetical protein
MVFKVSKIFSDYGIEVFKKEGNYYLELDCGEIAVIIDRIPVSKEEAERAMRSSDDAYNVIINFQNSERREVDLWYQRAREDNIDLSRNGFIRKHHSKEIYIYYINNYCFVPFYGEISGVPEYDFLIDGETEYITRKYSMRGPVTHITDKYEKLEIQKKLIQYLKDEKIRHDIKQGL